LTLQREGGLNRHNYFIVSNPNRILLVLSIPNRDGHASAFFIFFQFIYSSRSRFAADNACVSIAVSTPIQGSRFCAPVRRHALPPFGCMRRIFIDLPRRFSGSFYYLPLFGPFRTLIRSLIGLACFAFLDAIFLIRLESIVSLISRRFFVSTSSNSFSLRRT